MYLCTTMYLWSVEMDPNRPQMPRMDLFWPNNNANASTYMIMGEARIAQILICARYSSNVIWTKQKRQPRHTGCLSVGVRFMVTMEMWKPMICQDRLGTKTRRDWTERLPPVFVWVRLCGFRTGYLVWFAPSILQISIMSMSLNEPGPVTLS